MSLGGADRLGGRVRGWACQFQRDQRAQTLQDYATGIGIFLLVTAFVFTFIPTLFTPYDTVTGADETLRSERAADKTVQRITTDGPGNEIDNDSGTTFFTHSTADLRNAVGIAETENINVTVRGTDGIVEIDGTTYAAGETYNEQPTGSAARVVTSDDPECAPSCRVVIRIW